MPRFNRYEAMTRTANPLILYFSRFFSWLIDPAESPLCQIGIHPS